ncbi:FtsX-like permease family protein [Actinosynnema sp. NPDC020468]|uniref:ABC transporter permease n=1 Tax=Actinosynnema sp. NPDC020468 TaxID=3154488 RepID=UPI0033DF4E75
MLRTIIAGLKARTARLVLSSVAIALGVAFVTGTLVLTDAMSESMRDQFAKGARGVDVAVSLSGQGSESRGITPETVAKIRAAQGVAGADPRAYAQVPLIGGDGKARPAIAVPLAGTDSLRPYDLAQGRYPANPGEIAVDVRTVSSVRLELGKPVTLLGADEREHKYTLVGTYKQGAGAESLATGDHVTLVPSEWQTYAADTLPGEVVVSAAAGVSQQQLADNVKKAIGGQGFTVETGEQVTTKMLNEINQHASEFSSMLLAFAAIALVVASMVIYNTFTILIAQRTRELALMRCVGASRGQVFRSVLAEAVAMGLVASVLGFLGGLGVSAGLQKMIMGIGDAGESPVRLPVTALTVLAAFAVGVVITVLSAVLPARKATRVPPVAALRSQVDSGEEVRRTGKLRIASAVLLALVGGGVIAFSLNGTLKEEAAMLVAGAGTMVLLASVVVLGPVLVGPVNRVLGVVPRMIFGVPAKLASANAGRNPRRTAATTAALMIGVTIVAMITVVANSAKETANAEVDQRFPADYTVASAVRTRPLPTSIADDLAKVPAVAKVAPQVEIYGKSGYFTGVGKDSFGDLVRPTVVSGSLDALVDGTIAVGEDYAQQQGLKVGSTAKLETDSGSGDLEVVAVVKGQRMSDGFVTLPTAFRVDPAKGGYDSVLIKLKPGVADGRAQVEKVTDASPLAVLDSAAETKAQLGTQLDQVLAFIWALIGLAVVIALFGIANTLTLSVLERTRESALLRALGLTRGQLRLMLVVESVLMALMGAAIGMVLGVGFGWVLTEALSQSSIDVDLVVPYGQIGVMLAAAVVAAVLAAALPARRAARTSVVAGMAEA